MLSPTLGWPIRLARPGWPDAGRLVAQRPALIALLRAAAGTAAVRTAVNAGAGEGLYTSLLHRTLRPARVIEFDLQVPPPRALPGTLQARMRASLTAIPLGPAIADVAVCTEVLEHVADDERAVAELARVLRPGGRLVLSVPTPPAVPDPAHVREGYTLAELETLLGRHGLVVVDHRYAMHAAFKAVLRGWREGRMPLAAILALAWFDRLVPLGTPMDLAVLARKDDA